jgi:hypothetical protein
LGNTIDDGSSQRSGSETKGGGKGYLRQTFWMLSSMVGSNENNSRNSVTSENPDYEIVGYKNCKSIPPYFDI